VLGLGPRWNWSSPVICFWFHLVRGYAQKLFRKALALQLPGTTKWPGGAGGARGGPGRGVRCAVRGAVGGGGGGGGGQRQNNGQRETGYGGWLLASRRAGGSELREGLTEAQRGLRRRSCGQPRRPGRVACSSPLRLGCFYVSALGPGR
jgi:hypothetical protein